MINLLPPVLKDGYRYARRNYHLMHWVVMMSVAMCGAVALTGLGWFYIEHMAQAYASQIAVSKANLATQHYDETQKHIKDMSNNLELSVQVLSKQVLFSELLKQLGSLMPKDTRLTNLMISQTQGAIDISAMAKDQTAATQIQVNLSDSKNALFSKVDIVSITCEYTSSDTSYPCRTTLRALFTAKNPFLFINNTKRGN